MSSPGRADRAAADDRAGRIVEVRGLYRRADGGHVVITALVDTSVAGPREALASLTGGRATLDESASGGVSAAYVLWRRWTAADMPVTLTYNAANERPGLGDIPALLQQGMGTWNNVPGDTFSFAYGGPATTDVTCDDGASTIGWRTLVPGMLASTCTVISLAQLPDCDVLLPGAPPAQTSCRPIEADIAFDPAVNWSSGDATPGNAYDFQSVLLHELGHALGLDHSDAAGSVMRPVIAAGKQARALTADDTAGVLALYPAPAPLPNLDVRARAIAIARSP